MDDKTIINYSFDRSYSVILQTIANIQKELVICEKGTLITVVEDSSPENLECGRNYDLEDEDGDRIWNAYMVIRNGVKLEKGQNEHTTRHYS